MRFAIIFAVVAIVWFLIGELVTNIHGIIMRKRLSDILGTTILETEDYVDEKVKESDPDVEPASKYDIWSNSLLWPYTIYKANKGYKILTKEIRTQNTALNRGGESDDCKGNQRQSG